MLLCAPVLARLIEMYSHSAPIDRRRGHNCDGWRMCNLYDSPCPHQCLGKRHLAITRMKQ